MEQGDSTSITKTFRQTVLDLNSTDAIVPNSNISELSLLTEQTTEKSFHLLIRALTKTLYDPHFALRVTPA